MYVYLIQVHVHVCVDIATTVCTVYGHCSTLLAVFFLLVPAGLAFRVGTPPLLMIATNTATYACGIGDRIVEVQSTVYRETVVGEALAK